MNHGFPSRYRHPAVLGGAGGLHLFLLLAGYALARKHRRWRMGLE
ncbi:MAG TPA: hypothetical protein VGW34_04975 [Allosphingosinicella sp.]|nr:hypothetical protein [Allosphingosinicella sp.]